MKNLHAKMTAIVEGYITNYKDDFYKHDTNRLKTLKSGIWSIRTTGTDLTDTDKIFNDHFWSTEYRELSTISEAIRSVEIFHDRNQRFFEIKNDDIKEIAKEKALQILAQKVRQEYSRKLEILERESNNEFRNEKIF